jgi:uncharacterized protein YcfJ
MLKSITLAAAALAATAGATLPATATAQGYYGDGYYGSRYDRGYYDARAYDRGTYRVAPRNRRYAYRNDRYRRCDAGTGGTVIGAIAGGLLGNTVAGRGDKGLGTILGAVGGGLAGRAIDRADNPRGCR